MENDEAYIEHIESEEIKKLVNLIYSSKPEDVMQPEIHQKPSQNRDIHHEIARKIDQLSPQKKPK